MEQLFRRGDVIIYYGNREDPELVLRFDEPNGKEWYGTYILLSLRTFTKRKSCQLDVQQHKFKAGHIHLQRHRTDIKIYDRYSCKETAV